LGAARVTGVGGGQQRVLLQQLSIEVEVSAVLSSFIVIKLVVMVRGHGSKSLRRMRLH
tara:strand:+ start:5291 stop:5464 length:174 start_codon:yes stop_codon:yes gene_type:complete